MERSRIILVLVLAFLFGLVIALCEYAHAADYAVYAMKPKGEIICYRPYVPGMVFGKLAEKQCVVVLVKDATKAQMEELVQDGKYIADWQALDVAEPDIENTLCKDSSIRHQPFVDKKKLVNLQKDAAVFFNPIDKKWVDGASLTTAAEKTKLIEVVR